MMVVCVIAFTCSTTFSSHRRLTLSSNVGRNVQRLAVEHTGGG